MVRSLRIQSKTMRLRAPVAPPNRALRSLFRLDVDIHICPCCCPVSSLRRCARTPATTSRSATTQWPLAGRQFKSHARARPGRDSAAPHFPAIATSPDARAGSRRPGLRGLPPGSSWFKGTASLAPHSYELITFGFRRTRITESPRRNIFDTYRSLFTCFAFLPFPRGFSVQISFTFSRTILQCRSKALTRASSL